MINIFYKKNGTIELAQSVSALQGLTPDLVIWIDLLAPSGEEKHTVEEFLGVEIQSRAEAEEIEALPKELIVGKRIRKNHCEALLRKPADGAGFPKEIDGKCRYADLQEIMYYTEKAEKEGEEG